MRISDWSSDVGSSDLRQRGRHAVPELPHLAHRLVARIARDDRGVDRTDRYASNPVEFDAKPNQRLIHPGLKRAERAAADRKSVRWGKSVSERVDLGGRSIINKKKNKYNIHKKN